MEDRESFLVVRNGLISETVGEDSHDALDSVFSPFLGGSSFQVGAVADRRLAICPKPAGRHRRWSIGAGGHHKGALSHLGGSLLGHALRLCSRLPQLKQPDGPRAAPHRCWGRAQRPQAEQCLQAERQQQLHLTEHAS